MEHVEAQLDAAKEGEHMNIGQIKVEYIDHMGDDLMVVNAARTSFGKESDWATNADGTYAGPTNHLKPEDASLIRYLATGYRTKEWDEFLFEIIETVVSNTGSTTGVMTIKEELTALLHAYKRRAQHWAPFAHPHMQIRMKLPIFLARQFVKHQVGGVWSEESRRYMSSEPEFWFPKEWHGRPEDIKQGSDGVHPESVMWGQAAAEQTKSALAFYMQAVGSGVAPEEARIVLPLNTMTTVTWTGSLLFWSRVCNQRLDDHAQKAANELAGQIAAIAEPLFQVSWAALVGD